MMFKRKRYNNIAVDFDGVISNGKWPEIGEPNKRLILWLNKQQRAGDKVILWTYRGGDDLQAAVEACIKWGLWPDAVNENIPDNVNHFGTDCRKVYAGLYIDDKAKRIVWRRRR